MNNRTDIKVTSGTYKNRSGVIMDATPLRKTWVKIDGMDRQVCLYKEQLELSAKAHVDKTTTTIMKSTDATSTLGTSHTTQERNENQEMTMTTITSNKNQAASSSTQRRRSSILRPSTFSGNTATNGSSKKKTSVIDLTKGVSFNHPKGTPVPERKTKKPRVRRHSHSATTTRRHRRQSLNVVGLSVRSSSSLDPPRRRSFSTSSTTTQPEFFGTTNNDWRRLRRQKGSDEAVCGGI